MSEMAAPKKTSKQPPGPANKPSNDREWVGLAWAAWLQGERNYSALARSFGKDPHTVKDNLRKYAAQRSAELGAIDRTSEYIDGLEADLREALRTYRGSTNPNAKVGALKLAVQIRELLAAAGGVVTKREARENSGTIAVTGGFAEAIHGSAEAQDAAFALASAIEGGTCVSIPADVREAIEPGDTETAASGAD